MPLPEDISKNPLDELLKDPILRLAWNLDKLQTSFESMDKKLDKVILQAAEKSDLLLVKSELKDLKEQVRLIEEVKIEQLEKVKIRALEDWKVQMYAYATAAALVLSGAGIVVGHYWK